MAQDDRQQMPERPARAPRSSHSPAAWITLLIVVGLGLTADLYSKWWMFENIGPYPIRSDRERVLNDPHYDPVPWHEPKPMIPGILNARLVENRGAVFGLGQDKRAFFIAFTMLAIGVGVVLFARWTSARQRLAHVAIGLILAGGIGNLYDRIQFGYVRDFLHLLPDTKMPFGLSWWGGSNDIFPWVFNVADVMLLSGMVLLAWHINRLEARRKKRMEAEEPALAAEPDSPPAEPVAAESSSKA